MNAYANLFTKGLLEVERVVLVIFFAYYPRKKNLRMAAVVEWFLKTSEEPFPSIVKLSILSSADHFNAIKSVIEAELDKLSAVSTVLLSNHAPPGVFITIT